MATKFSLVRLCLKVAVGSVLLGGASAHAATFERWDGISDHIGLAGGPATLIARKLTTPVGETTGAWHYHPGYVYNVVAEGVITVEDGCGEVKHLGAGEAFETSEGRVHRAYNLGTVDAVEYNMFINIGEGNHTLTKFIPNDEQRCGPPSTVDECRNGGWTNFDWPEPFANQGACIAYVNNRPTITLLVPADPL
jgi:quercetin dioxygenase-like cupin family protein